MLPAKKQKPPFRFRRILFQRYLDASNDGNKIVEIRITEKTGIVLFIRIEIGLI
jgi:hypothetical protein